MCECADEVEKHRGPVSERTSVAKGDGRVDRVLAAYDPSGPRLDTFVDASAWGEVMDFVVRGAMVRTIAKFVRVRPDRLVPGEGASGRKRPRVQFRWMLEPKFPWSVSIVYKDQSVVSYLASAESSFADVPSSGAWPCPVFAKRRVSL